VTGRIGLAREQWIGPALLAALAYLLVGVVTADLAGAAATPHMRTFWRLVAWGLSLAVFVGHLALEQTRHRSSVKIAAVHVAAAVALGAFALAAAGPVRSHWNAPDLRRVSLLSLALWPMITGVPAFLAALVGGAILKRLVVRDGSAPSHGAART
jgi:hypothetical protein